MYIAQGGVAAVLEETGMLLVVMLHLNFRNPKSPSWSNVQLKLITSEKMIIKRHNKVNKHQPQSSVFNFMPGFLHHMLVSNTVLAVNQNSVIDKML